MNRSAPLQRYNRTRLRLELLELRDLPSGAPAWAAGAAPGGQPLVSVYDANNQLVTSFLAYESTFTGGVRVAVADLNGDGTLDTITGAGPGGAVLACAPSTA